MGPGEKKIAIVSCCVDDWGGSEELWAKSIPFLHDFGHQVSVYKTSFNKEHPEIKKLRDLRVSLKGLTPSLIFYKRIVRQVAYLYNRMLDRTYHIGADHYLIQNFRREISKQKPNLVLISQGINFDGLRYAYECFKLNIPYLIVSQKAVDFYWPQVQDKAFMKTAFAHARLCCFVSSHNLRLTEEQFGFRFKNSQLVYNPVKLDRKPLEYPSTDNGFRLACVGRFFLIDKGQDILIRILAQEKWRGRPITVSLVGNGIDLMNIQEMINLYQLKNIQIESFQSNMESFWLGFHALILPSRSEGLPLTIIEAMAAGRPVITTNAGGNTEMVVNGVTGFIGEANEHAFDEAMETAWENRSRWESMGLSASDFIQKNVPKVPEQSFAVILNKLL